MRRHITTVYQLKIVLEGVRPQVWRRVQVPDDIPLDALHLVIQAAMGWTDSHLHSFSFDEAEYSASYEDGDLDEMEMEDEHAVPLSDLVAEPKERFGYRYDFGDDWDHDVRLEKILPAAPGAVYPLCLAGQRNCPPEDCGGAGGYARLLKVLADPKHPEYGETREWMGRKFDAEAFDLEKVNRRLKRLRTWV